MNNFKKNCLHLSVNLSAFSKPEDIIQQYKKVALKQKGENNESNQQQTLFFLLKNISRF